MLQNTLLKMQTLLSQSDKLNNSQREQLLKLYETLREDLAELAKSDPQLAEHIAGVTEKATQESLAGDGLSSASETWQDAIRSFEAKHSKLAALVQRIAITLSDMGI